MTLTQVSNELDALALQMRSVAAMMEGVSVGVAGGWRIRSHVSELRGASKLAGDWAKTMRAMEPRK